MFPFDDVIMEIVKIIRQPTYTMFIDRFGIYYEIMMPYPQRNYIWAKFNSSQPMFLASILTEVPHL